MATLLISTFTLLFKITSFTFQIFEVLIRKSVNFHIQFSFCTEFKNKMTYKPSKDI